jgi:hypothetical protein
MIVCRKCEAEKPEGVTVVRWLAEHIKVCPAQSAEDQDLVSKMEKAKVLIESVEAALKAGTEHWNKAGKKLETVEDILRCLQDEGGISFKPKDLS